MHSTVLPRRRSIGIIDHNAVQHKQIEAALLPLPRNRRSYSWCIKAGTIISGQAIKGARVSRRVFVEAPPNNNPNNRPAATAKQ